MKNTIIIAVIVAVVFGAGGFFGGMQYQKSQRPSFGNGNFQFQGNGQGNRNFSRSGGQSGQANQFQRGNGGGRVAGEILSIDNNTMTVKMPDGSSKIVILSDTTQYTQSSQGSQSDLQVGQQVGVFGVTNSDGSVTAQDVQINPAFRLNPSGAPQQ